MRTKLPLRLLTPRLLAYRRPVIIAVHVALIPLGFWTAFALRFDFAVPPEYVARFWDTLPILLALRLIVFERFGLYRGYWRHVSLRDLADLVAAVTLGSCAFGTVLVLAGAFPGFPRSVLLLDWLLMIFLGGGIRSAARLMRETNFSLREAPGRRTLVIGAGEGGELFIRQVLRGGNDSLHLVGVVDDDPETHGRSLHGLDVLGGTADLGWLTTRYRVELLVIAIAAASGDQMRRIIERCRETQLEFKIIPSLDELLQGRAHVGQLRDVQIENLLGREPVTLQLDCIERDIAGKVVLITGAAGSIGFEIARQVARLRPARLVLLERAESPLYFAQLELARQSPQTPVVPVIADITNATRIDALFAQYRPDYVLHAAAYKHVPLMEAHVGEAVRNNVLGTLLVASAAAKHGVGKFVLISTDKAVNPSSILGVTKRIAERTVLELPALRTTRTDFRAVRFGNVLGSDGSVIPVFQRQLANGGPLTVTHPDMRRYFMTIPEAVQLVLEAAALPGAAGRIAMLDMGRSVRILDLAEQLIRLSGRTPYTEVPIVFTGLRPGEKLDEELMACSESTVPTAVDAIRLIERNGADGAAVESGLATVIRALASGNRDWLIRELLALVPEYTPWAGNRPAADVEVRIPAIVDRAAGDGVRAPVRTPAPAWNPVADRARDTSHA